MLSPSWANDQKTICFVGLRKSGFKDIYTYNVETKERKQLTNDFYEDNDPSWSNDDKYIVFSSDRTEKGNEWAYNIFRLNIQTGKTDYLTYGKKKDSSPVYSPNGKYLAYVSTENLEKNIYLISTDSKKLKKIKLTNYISTVFDINWVNNDEIVFSVFTGGRFKLQHLKGVEKKWNGKTDLFAENHQFPIFNEKTWVVPDLAKMEKVSIKNYECFDEEGSLKVGRIVGQLKALGIEAPEIYGIKKPQLNRVKKLNNWTCLRYWVLEHIKDKLTDPSFVEKLKNS